MQDLWAEKVSRLSCWQVVMTERKEVQPQSVRTVGPRVLEGFGGPMLAVARERKRKKMGKGVMVNSEYG